MSKTTPVEEAYETLITYYGLQKNVRVLKKVEGKPIEEHDREHLGYFLTIDKQVAECYRNNKSIEAKTTSMPEKVKYTDGSIKPNGNTISTQTTKVNAKPCGSHCAMFQLYTTGKDKGIKSFARLNCVKVDYELMEITENEFLKK